MRHGRPHVPWAPWRQVRRRASPLRHLPTCKCQRMPERRGPAGRQQQGPAGRATQVAPDQQQGALQAGGAGGDAGQLLCRAKDRLRGGWAASAAACWALLGGAASGMHVVAAARPASHLEARAAGQVPPCIRSCRCCCRRCCRCCCCCCHRRRRPPLRPGCPRCRRHQLSRLVHKRQRRQRRHAQPRQPRLPPQRADLLLPQRRWCFCCCAVTAAAAAAGSACAR
jgi:hypothetical protein